VVSKCLLYVEMDANTTARHVHYAPYLDYRPIATGEPGIESILDRPEGQWITRELESRTLNEAAARHVRCPAVG
jgi:hypothetical protein